MVRHPLTDGQGRQHRLDEMGGPLGRRRLLALQVACRLGSRPLLGSYPRRRVLVMGTNATVAPVVATIRAQRWLDMDIVGTVVATGCARNLTTRPPAPSRSPA